MQTFHDQLRSIANESAHADLPREFDEVRVPSRFPLTLAGLGDASRALSPIAFLIAMSSLASHNPNLFPNGNPVRSLHPSLVFSALSNTPEICAHSGATPGRPLQHPRIPESGSEEEGSQARRSSRQERQLWVIQRLLMRAERSLEQLQIVRACADLQRFDLRYSFVENQYQQFLAPHMRGCLLALEQADRARTLSFSERSLLRSHKAIISDKLAAFAQI